MLSWQDEHLFVIKKACFWQASSILMLSNPVWLFNYSQIQILIFKETDSGIIPVPHSPHD
jgi:hypothetical protein